MVKKRKEKKRKNLSFRNCCFILHSSTLLTLILSCCFIPCYLFIKYLSGLSKNVRSNKLAQLAGIALFILGVAGALASFILGIVSVGGRAHFDMATTNSKGAHAITGLICMSLLTLCAAITLQNEDFYRSRWSHSSRAVDQTLVATLAFGLASVYCGIADINAWAGWYGIVSAYVGFVLIVIVMFKILKHVAPARQNVQRYSNL